MLRYFLVLAVTDGSLLVASLVLGFLASGEQPGPGAIWRGVHLLFALFTKIFAIRAGFHPPYPPLESLSRYVTLEVGLAAGAAMVLIGVVALVVAVASWGAVGFGSLDPSLTMREVIPAVVLLALGSQTVFASFFISILSIDLN